MTDDQARAAYLVGLERHRKARADGQQHAYAYDGNTIAGQRVDGFAAVAEQFVALETGREWIAKPVVRGRRDEGDIAGDISVRWTPLEHGRLPLHPEDADHLRFVLVRGKWPEMRIAGFILARDGKRREYWTTKGVRTPAFFVPVEALEPIASLCLPIEQQLEDIGRHLGVVYGEAQKEAAS